MRNDRPLSTTQSARPTVERRDSAQCPAVGRRDSAQCSGTTDPGKGLKKNSCVYVHH